VVKKTLDRFPNREPGSVGEVLQIDEESRAVARQAVAEYSREVRPVLQSRSPVSLKA
jgi:hypothetical protein